MTDEHVSIQPLVKWIFLLLFVILLAGALTLRYSFTNANNSDQVKQGNQISACRSSAHLGIDTANEAVSFATSQQGIANSQLQELIATGFAASVANDVAATAAVVAEKAEAFSRIDAANRAISQAQVELKAATQVYRTAVSESLAHPERFLRSCGAPTS